MSTVKYSGVLSNSATIEATKIVRPHKSHMRQYKINLVHRGQTIGPQSTHAGTVTFGPLNMKTFHSSPLPSGILHFPIVARSVSQKAALQGNSSSTDGLHYKA
jgi:hypothetical protein